MRLTAIFAVLAAVSAAVVAAPHETNADRLARGLSPNPPVQLGTKVATAENHKPSHTPPHEGGHDGPCEKHSPLSCCEHVYPVSNPTVKIIAGLAKIPLPSEQHSNVQAGLKCSRLSIDDAKHGKCKHQMACCKEDKFRATCAVGCTPVKL